MKTLEEIRDIVAKNRGYENWETLNGSDLYDSDIDEVARLYSESKTAQLKADKEELIDILERTRNWYEENNFRFGEYTPVIFNEMLSLIQKHK